MQIKGDFHVHSNYCPHGTNDSMEKYIEIAIKHGFKHLSFTEHAPLPEGFIDPTPDRDSGMRWDEVDDYINEISKLKEKYKRFISINVGFEVDFIEGYETETKKLLDRFGQQIDDAILSVHMLKAPNGEYVCLDYSLEEFKRITDLFDTIDHVHKAYYHTVVNSIKTDLGLYKPSRIGHITLVNKFSKTCKPINDYKKEVMTILHLMKEQQLELDVNTAGLYKEHCGSIYPNIDLLEEAGQIGLSLVPGSDSHTYTHIGRGFDLLPSTLNYSIPRK
ncbi:histidinol-phosphatase HisJ [Aquibacillus kalidii]|uniref:histidinol-phosphatase HisJ n=1 Tax=Aquibacillus kalidii TaxID=2762597 RepID=UPI0016440D6A|nr:histidinol-phosphatase HisJ [Aquibacillus kalidii]